MGVQESFANSLRLIKAEHNLSIIALSEKTGVSRSTIQNILKGTGNLRKDTVECIAEKIGIETCTLLLSYHRNRNDSLEQSVCLLETVGHINRLDYENKIKYASVFQRISNPAQQVNP